MTADKQLLTADEIFWHHEWENTFMIDMHSKFYEARLIRTMFLVEISLGKEPDLAGFEGKLWQLINSCWQLIIFFDNMDEKMSSWLVCNQSFMNLGLAKISESSYRPNLISTKTMILINVSSWNFDYKPIMSSFSHPC